MASQQVQVVVKEAKLRAVDASRPEPDGGFNAPRALGARGGGSRGGPVSLYQLAVQPVFVPFVPGTSRVFASEPVALPPFPCCLCRDADFGTEGDFRRHVSEEHVSWVEYRKCVIYAATKRRMPVTPQVWRLVVGHVTEEVVTGQSDWPACQDEGVADEDLQHRASILRHLNPAAADAGGLAKLVGRLLRLKKTQNDAGPTGAGYDKFLQLVQAEDPEMRLCTQVGNSTPFTEVAQRALFKIVDLIAQEQSELHDGALLQRLAGEIEASLLQQCLNSEDEEEEWPTEDTGPHWWQFSEYTTRRGLVLRHLLRPVTEAAGLVGFFQQLRRDILLFCPDGAWQGMAIPAIRDKLAEQDGFYLRWFRHAAVRDTEKRVVISVLEVALQFCSEVELDATEEELLSAVASRNADTSPGDPSSAELWEWAAAGAAEYVAKCASVKMEALGSVESDRRRVIRHRKACCVCARSRWATELDDVYFFDLPPGSSEAAIITDDRVDVRAGEAFQRKADPEAPPPPTRRSMAQALLSPQTYHDRWRFPLAGGAGVGGIPLEELQASAVRDPTTGDLWLLHRKAFKFLEDRCTVDVTKKVPICVECRGSLVRQRPTVPKYSLANDLWMGCMPEALKGLSEGAWLLLPLARAMIRRYNCKSEGSRWKPADQQVKAFIGNVCAFPQADGGACLQTMPPDARHLQESLLIVFTGLEEDVERGYHKELGVSLEKFKRAYMYLRHVNALYAETRWDEPEALVVVAAAAGLAEGTGGVLAQIGGRDRRSRPRSSGGPG
jgi:hypothetical protein